MIGPRFVARALSPPEAVVDVAGFAWWRDEMIGDAATGELPRGEAGALTDRIAALAEGV